MLLVALIATIFTAKAEPESGDLSIKPMAGLNISNFTDEGDAKVGFAFGAEAEYMINDWAGISGGLLFSRQGSKEGDLKVHLDYINVPILANFYIFKGLSLEAGIQPGFKVNAKAKMGGVSTDLDDVKSVDFAIPVGVAYDFNNLEVGLRYNISATKVMSDVDDRNSNFMISVGYKFHLK